MLEVGRVVRAHGLRGEVVVEFITNRPERVAPGAQLVAAGRSLEVLQARPQGAAGLGNQRWLVSFAGVEGRDAAEALCGTVLEGAPLDDPDVLWVHQLIGAEVRDPDGRSYGKVKGVEANPASDLLVLEGGQLVPVRFVTASGEGVLTVEAPPGLLEP